MLTTKKEWLDFFREEADREVSIVQNLQSDYKNRAGELNKRIKTIRDDKIKDIVLTNCDDEKKLELLNAILLITYTSNIVMLESRNIVWAYDYMTFARRIGELWEPFCKLAFEFSLNPLSIIEPPLFSQVQADIQDKAKEYIESLNITQDEKNELKKHFDIPWSLVDSGGIKLELDLHFEQNETNYNCDFKSGFSSNEKGNTNRLLLVGSIYHSLSEKEKTLLFVRQNEDENNHYLITLKNSPYWEVYCANDCYDKMKEFTGFDMREWLDNNAEWQNDITTEFYDHLSKNGLLKYLTW